MFGVDSGELFIIVLVAVVVIGPKELPRVMRTVGHWIGKARGMANQFRSGVDEMVRESEIADLEKKWREQNEAIMKANPLAPADSGWGLASPPPAAAAVSLDKRAEADGPVMLDKPADFDTPVMLAKPDPAPPPEGKTKGPTAPAPISAAYPAPRSGAGTA